MKIKRFLIKKKNHLVDLTIDLGEFIQHFLIVEENLSSILKKVQISIDKDLSIEDLTFFINSNTTKGGCQDEIKKCNRGI